MISVASCRPRRDAAGRGDEGTIVDRAGQPRGVPARPSGQEIEGS